MLIFKIYNKYITVKNKKKGFEWTIESIYKLYLKENFKELNKIDKIGYTPLILTTLYDEDLALNLAVIPEIDINKKTRFGETALMCCCYFHFVNKDVFKILLKRPDLDINSQNHVKNTALHIASEKEPSLIPLLLEHPDIDLTIKNFANETAWDIAMRTHTNNALIFKTHLEKMKIEKSNSGILQKNKLNRNIL